MYIFTKNKKKLEFISKAVINNLPNYDLVKK